METAKFMKIDLHVHTRDYSACGRSTAEEQIEAAIEAGLDAIVFAEHDTLFPLARIRKFNHTYAPFRIFSGIEMSVIGGEHLLVLGVHDNVLEQRRWQYPDLYALVREQGGFLALNHPFRFNPVIEIDHEQFPPDAIEGFSNNITTILQHRIVRLAKMLDLPILSNSDAHHSADLGRHYNVLSRIPKDEQELLAILKAGDFHCVAPEYCDAPT
jgi:histidinol phosphatase-like PHP family hydrolase